MYLKNALSVTTPNDREIQIERSFNAPPHLVYDAYTKPELIRRWLYGPDGWSFLVCEVDLMLGGQYRYVWRHDGDGSELAVTGVFREIVPAQRLVSTELFDQDWTGGEARTSIVFSPREDGRTDMRQTVTYSSKQARDGALATGMTEGLGMGYERLDAFLGEMPR